VLFNGEVELPGHTTQSAGVVAAEAVEYVPATQAMHAPLPVVLLYCPSRHTVHGPSLGPVKPFWQMQAASAVLAVGDVEPIGHARHSASDVATAVDEYVPAAQSVHAALPMFVLNVPAEQGVHAPPSRPVKPALHTQTARAELRLGELEFTGQARHVVATVAATVVEYVPAAQSVHTALPLTVLKLPAAQAVHTSPFAPL
jgi:hypothetical protein